VNAKVRGITVTINGDTKGLGKVLDTLPVEAPGFLHDGSGIVPHG